MRYDLRAVAAAVLLSLVCALVFGGVPALQAARIGLVGSAQGRRRRARLGPLPRPAEAGAGGGRGRALGRCCSSRPACCCAASGRSRPCRPASSRGRPRRDPRARRPGLSRSRPRAGLLPRRARATPRAAWRHAAAAISWTPLGSGGAATSFTISGREAPLPGQEPIADIRVVTPGLFETLRIPLLDGRDLGRTTAPVRRASPSSATRSRASSGPAAPPSGNASSFAGEAIPTWRSWASSATCTSRRSTLPRDDGVPAARPGREQLHDADAADERLARALVPGVRAVVASLDRALPVGSALPLDEVVGHSLRSRRFVLVLVAVFGARRWRSRGSGSSA